MLGHSETLQIALRGFTQSKRSEGSSVWQHFIKSFTGLQNDKELKVCMFQGYTLRIYIDLEV